MIDFNAKEHPDAALIEEARMSAESDWEEEFVADIIAKVKRYGASWNPTAAQRAKLFQIAGREELGDGFDKD